MLKHLIDTKPKYKENMDALIDNPNDDGNLIVESDEENQGKD